MCSTTSGWADECEDTHLPFAPRVLLDINGEDAHKQGCPVQTSREFDGRNVLFGMLRCAQLFAGRGARAQQCRVSSV